mmetsp:Transcript_23288/g.72831  ORF Transcript_23288/g.72831 Transcript_23288/m.72831 type:complete len:322 (-) Transcript_23288:1618-2583(-)
MDCSCSARSWALSVVNPSTCSKRARSRSRHSMVVRPSSSLMEAMFPAALDCSRRLKSSRMRARSSSATASVRCSFMQSSSRARSAALSVSTSFNEFTSPMRDVSSTLSAPLSSARKRSTSRSFSRLSACISATVFSSISKRSKRPSRSSSSCARRLRRASASRCASCRLLSASLMRAADSTAATSAAPRCRLMCVSFVSSTACLFSSSSIAACLWCRSSRSASLSLLAWSHSDVRRRLVRCVDASSSRTVKISRCAAASEWSSSSFDALDSLSRFASDCASKLWRSAMSAASWSSLTRSCSFRRSPSSPSSSSRSLCTASS